jgi:hypothetical protein
MLVTSDIDIYQHFLFIFFMKKLCKYLITKNIEIILTNVENCY